MKTTIIISFTFLLLTIQGLSQNTASEQKDNHVPLIGETAPSFVGESTRGRINFPSDYFGKWKILFSHPADFTAVCSSEILELADLQDEFDKLGTQLIVLSVDGINSHIEWQRSLEKINYKDRGPRKINFPLVSDGTLEISKRYGMIHSYSSTSKNVRGVFIIDQDNIIRAITFYPMNIGRNIDEIKRTLIALQTAADKNVLMPANWQPGQDVMLPSPKTVTDAEKLAEKNDPDLYQLAWYMWFKKMK